MVVAGGSPSWVLGPGGQLTPGLWLCPYLHKGLWDPEGPESLV